MSLKLGDKRLIVITIAIIAIVSLCIGWLLHPELGFSGFLFVIVIIAIATGYNILKVLRK